jgi:hypothetical protein
MSAVLKCVAFPILLGDKLSRQFKEIALSGRTEDAAPLSPFRVYA